MKTIRTFEKLNRDTMIKLDANNGVCTVDMCMCLDETGSRFQLAGTVSGPTAFDMLVGPEGLCTCGESEFSQFEEVKGTDLNGVEEGEDRISDEDGDGVEGEG